MIGIVGNGFVGNAVRQNLKDKIDCKVFDVDSSRSLNTFEEVIGQEFIFVCLPTPMKSTGECDLSILDNFFDSLPEKVNGIFIIKSTVPVGTTKKYSANYKVIHNPEFLTARNAVEDFKNSERNIIGGKKDLCEKFATLFAELFPTIPNIITSSDESEAIKYFSLNLDFDLVCNGVTLDSRIGKSHSKVPGVDGDRGFGGTCFPKDLNSLAVQMEENQINSDMLKSVWEYNKQIRRVIDWPVT
jgi:UDPglucose 6-dehydrogenase